MINLKYKKECCGCNACVQICPRNCINMAEDVEGFLYPQVEESICVSCGLCERVCPMSNEKNGKFLISYAAYANNDELRMKSSSGAIFPLCAEEVLNQQGVVFGAVFDENFEVHHIAIDNHKDLLKLQGSKYMQSRIENTYKEAETYLKLGRTVLYSGVGCQIAGLKNFLGKEYDNLYTIDVLCHGVPSSKVWRKYWLELKENLDNGNSVTFRDKTTGWKSYSVKYNFNNKEHKELASKNTYMRLFLSDICLRPSCHDCKYKSLERPSDLTLGDSWGIENYKPHMDDDKGTSVVLVHTDKGHKLFSNIKDRMVYEEADIDKILPPTADSRKSVKMHVKRKQFFNMLEQGESIESIAKILKPTILDRFKYKCRNILRKIKNVLRKFF